jgi:hypothetical protein
LPESIYQAGIDAFGKQGMAESIYLVGCLHLVGVILNGYDVSVPGREDGEPTLEAQASESDASRDKTFSR